MTLSARSIALQGFGVGALVGAGVLSVALQGLVPIREPATTQAGGGRSQADAELALQVARGERGSGGWWGYVKPAGLALAAEPQVVTDATPAKGPAARRGQTEEALLVALLLDAGAEPPVLGAEEVVLLQALGLADRGAQVHHAPVVRLSAAGDEDVLLAALLLAEQQRLDDDDAQHQRGAS